MPENAPGTEILDLTATFPAVSVAEWEATIQKDLKGADYEKELVWRAEEGINVRPYYCQESVQGLGDLIDLAPAKRRLRVVQGSRGKKRKIGKRRTVRCGLILCMRQAHLLCKNSLLLLTKQWLWFCCFGSAYCFFCCSMPVRR